jgi:hypothetical protein
MKTFATFLGFMLTLGNFATEKDSETFRPGELWLDNNGVHINAHGGGILFHQGKYYWFGEHKTEGRRGNQAWVGVHCYSSENLYDWMDEGIALPVSKAPESPIAEGCIMERPKVIFNSKTGKFVMWFHLELKGQGYNAAQTGVAIADNPTGPYTFLKALNPNAGEWPVNYSNELKQKEFSENPESWSDEWKQAVKDGLFVHRDLERGQMSRDMTLYVDENGTAYHIHASEENLTLHISELTPDYTGFTGKYTRVLPTGHNEAPAIFKHNNKYYMITSGCTGWDPNAARLLVSNSVMGNWEYLKNPCAGDDAEITFDSQSTLILPVQGKKDAFIFMADRWRPQNAIDGRYVWLPVQFDDQGIPFLKWLDEWDVSFFDR